ncbi:MAG: hypothetical protein KF681_09855 [Bdellovibrionaceae bacterium]|nr:hypothetical protein [Pseudobdellovibrionaceae bacterium]
MRYSLGDSVAEGGFRLFEKIHEPIFLIHKKGRIVRMNEAGRKFLTLTKLSQAEHGLCALFQGELERLRTLPFVRRCLPGSNLMLIGTSYESSDYALVEIKRSKSRSSRKLTEAKERWTSKLSITE